nr:TetR/AcrR family transcriptional regulator [uncultured Lichenicoccus sp.]
MKASQPSVRKTGRPLSFDPQAALEPAMLLFWRHGYEATSLAELTRAMGVTSPSIYAAYGDKKGLFRAAVRRYLTQPQTPVAVIAQAPNAATAARTLVEGAAIAFTGTDTPAGCLLASSAIAVSAEADDVREELAAIRREIETALRDRISDDIKAGRLPPATDRTILAAYVMTVIQGLSTLARDGATRAKLEQVAQFALALWPQAPPGKL